MTLIDGYSPWRDARPVNSEHLEELAECIETNSCRPGQKTVVLLASFHFSEYYATLRFFFCHI
jgi:hypothetical protein